MSQPRLLKSHRPHRLVHLHRVYHRVIPKSRRSKTTLTRLYHKAVTPIIIAITSLNHRRMKTTRIISPHRSRCLNLNRSPKRRRIKLLPLQRRLIQPQLQQRRLAAVITRSRPRLLASPKRTWKRNDASWDAKRNGCSKRTRNWERISSSLPIAWLPI